MSTRSGLSAVGGATPVALLVSENHVTGTALEMPRTLRSALIVYRLQYYIKKSLVRGEWRDFACHAGVLCSFVFVLSGLVGVRTLYVRPCFLNDALFHVRVHLDTAADMLSKIRIAQEQMGEEFAFEDQVRQGLRSASAYVHNIFCLRSNVWLSNTVLGALFCPQCLTRGDTCVRCNWSRSSWK